jgi:hypothetical protein
MQMKLSPPRWSRNEIHSGSDRAADARASGGVRSAGCRSLSQRQGVTVFDKPTLAMTIGYATFPNLAAYAFVRWLGVDVFAYLAVFFVGFGSLYAIVMQLQGEFENFKHLQDTPKPIYRNEPLRIPNLNKPTYETGTPLVKIDVMGIKIKRCCRTLINQRENGFKIDLREETWKAQFGGRENFVQFRDVIMCNAFAKENPERKNSAFVVVDWKEIQRGAEGRIR